MTDTKTALSAKHEKKSDSTYLEHSVKLTNSTDSVLIPCKNAMKKSNFFVGLPPEAESMER